MNEVAFISLITAHIVGDFYLQNDKYCRQKEEKKVKSCFLYIHSIIIGGISWMLIPSKNFWIYALIIAISHLVIDALKTYCSSGLKSFALDQIAHIAVIAIIAYIYKPVAQTPIQIIDCYHSFSAPMLLLGLLICFKPANIIIKIILKNYDVGEATSCSNIKNAGALIGNLERILTIIFVILGQYEAIGFIVAAKSLLRFKDTDTAKTEYVLAGTFLSFGIAIICGILAKR